MTWLGVLLQVGDQSVFRFLKLDITDITQSVLSCQVALIIMPVLGVILHRDYIPNIFQDHQRQAWHAKASAELIVLSPEAFWILGLLNNFLWVVMNAGAGSINEARH